MDPIASIVKITAAVMRRLADSIDAQDAPAEPIVVHVHCHHDTIPRTGWRHR